MLPDSHWLEKLNDEKHALIIEAIESNLPYVFAAGYARICERTLYTWISKGKEDIANALDTKFSRLLHDIKTAEAKKVQAHLGACEAQSERWQARMTILERRWRSEFSVDGGEIIELRKQMDEIKTMFKSIMEPAQVNKSE